MGSRSMVQLSQESFVPEPQRPDHEATATPVEVQRADHQESHPYVIRRKGSRYNIFGPNGRVFTKYQSASMAGPRWEELTRTPWPFRSSAYQPGMRLWQLGLIERQDVGQTRLRVRRSVPTTHQASEHTIAPTDQSPAYRADVARVVLPQRSVSLGQILPDRHPALPAPRIDTDRQERLIRALRQNPNLLFHPEIRQCLRIEVEYHRPYARWAQKLLRLLARYEARQRHRRPQPAASSETILARHIAWQEQQLAQRHATTS